MQNKTILITGSTDGIGKQTALELAKTGATILLHGRDASRGESTLNEIRDKTGNDKLDFLLGDMSSLKQVRDLAAKIHERTNKLDVLLNNAGTMAMEKEFSEDGVELTFAVNHLAMFLLTNLLLDLMKSSAPSRIINTSSNYHEVELELDNLCNDDCLIGADAYAHSKLCTILFTQELARRLEGTGVTVNCLHPGVIGTKLLHLIWPDGGDPVETSAKTPVYLATSPDVEGVTGKYFEDKAIAEPAKIAQDDSLARKLWDFSEKLTVM